MSVLTRKSTIWLATLPVFALALSFGQKAEQASAQRYVDHVKFLAAPEMQGGAPEPRDSNAPQNTSPTVSRS